MPSPMLQRWLQASTLQMRFIFLNLFIPSVTFCFCQDNSLTLKQVRQAIDNSYQDLIRKETRIVSTPWATCNDDSTFFKSDTVRLYKNTSNFFGTKGCCNYLYWSFMGKKDMSQETTYSTIATSSPCEDTTLLKGEKHSTSIYLTYQLESQENKILITTFNNKKVINIFQVLNIDKVIAGEDSQITERMILKKIK